jgi:sulfate adenylyltransferase
MNMIAPYGGSLVNLVADVDERAQWLARLPELTSVQISARALHDLELLSVGAFSPLRGFLGHDDYVSVLRDMRLADGTLWPIPITLTVARSVAPKPGHDVVLRNAHNDPVAVLHVEEVFDWERPAEARAVFGKDDPRHPVVAEMAGWGERCLAGRLRVLQLSRPADFAPLRLVPAETRARLAALGRSQVVAFQTRNPLHRSHEELTRRAAAAVDGTLLIHPVVGMTRPGDVDHFTRVRTYKALVERYYDPARTLLSLLPLAMRLAGPREALWHAILRRNYGATHFIVGRDHAGPGIDSTGRPFFGPEEAQRLAMAHAADIGVTILPFGELVYLPDEDRYEEAERVAAGRRTISLSGTEVRGMLARGQALPAWFTRPETARILAGVQPPLHERGFCVWFTGLSGAGKSATAEALTALLLERGRRVTLLDGDVVRTHLSRGLGFSREDRDMNVQRIGFVAAEIVRHRGAAVCAAVSPYRSARNACRALVGESQFFEVFVDTPIEVCERRDTKGLYAKARRGELPRFTGVDDPYEAPLAPELVLTTEELSPGANAARVVELLTVRGFLADATSS